MLVAVGTHTHPLAPACAPSTHMNLAEADGVSVYVGLGRGAGRRAGGRPERTSGDQVKEEEGEK